MLLAASWVQSGQPDRPGVEPHDDRDGDGIVDSDDRCIDRAGLAPDGCPPSDRDGDGILDRVDDCADAPGPDGNNGCPDTDGDGDSVVDRVDRCPQTIGHVDFAGCRAPDSDGDGIPDPGDQCVEGIEIWNGVDDNDGCPDRGESLVTITGGRVVFTRGRVFRSTGQLATRGRKAVAVAASALEAVRAERVRIVVAISRRRAGKDGLAVADQRAHTLAAQLAKHLPRLKIAFDPQPPQRRLHIELVYPTDRDDK
ncbi:MAG: hypothetical protein MJE77_27165 [Proteobacteria bacterium]|nr:hypothetical protein [Pseudomonadota bacterium]